MREGEVFPSKCVQNPGFSNKARVITVCGKVTDSDLTQQILWPDLPLVPMRQLPKAAER